MGASNTSIAADLAEPMLPPNVEIGHLSIQQTVLLIRIYEDVHANVFDGTLLKADG